MFSSFISVRPSNLLLAVALVLFVTVEASAQQETKTIVLKDGTVVVGTIIRQTDDTLEVLSASDTLWIATSAIRRIRNRVTTAQGQDTSVTGGTTQPNDIGDAFHVWEIFAGVAVPTGSFASTDMSRIGFASTGACLGGLYRLDLEKEFEVGIKGIFDYYPFDRDAFAGLLTAGTQLDVGSWYLIWTLGSIGLHAEVTPNERLHAAALLGYMYGISPNINATNGPASFRQTSAGSQGFGYGGEIGYYIRGVDIEVRYLAAEIEYKFNTQSGGSFTIRQPTAAVQISIGVAFR